MKIVNWLDSSAVLTLLMGEQGVATVRDMLADAEHGRRTLCLSPISLVEITHALARAFGAEIARDDLRLILEMPVEIRTPDNRLYVEAGLLRARHKLSTADALIAVQAMDADAVLIHKDPEFEAIPNIKQAPLPYKTAQR